MDTQIWYAIFSTIYGGIYGAFRRLGEVGEGLFLYKADIFILFFYIYEVNKQKINERAFMKFFKRSW